MSHETIEELTFKKDGSQAYRYSDDDVRVSMASSWELANCEPASEITWEADTEEDDDLDVAVSVAYLDMLLSKARAYDRIMALCVHAPRCECE